MKKYVLSFLFLLSLLSVFGQKKSQVSLVNAESSESKKTPDGKIMLIVHNGLFKQDYSTLRSDSAYFYPDRNAVDAFGHVIINQGDTLHIYSDKLNYNGNTKLAILIDHVTMVDKDATLTTNYLTYNTATRIANYTGGGKMVNKDNTLVSKNGYYFAFSRDAYFRYNVVCTTPDAVIKTDTLRYNNGTRIAYFYGPTHIYGAKDKDTLYTEDGTYSTITEQARFGKKNLYSQGTKSLKGDSLFYDRLKGYGRAVKHVTFNDNEQKTAIKGGLGEYYSADGRAVVTQNPYMIVVTEEKDTSKTDSVNHTRRAAAKTDSVSKKAQVQNKADSATIKRLGLAPAVKAKEVPKNDASNKTAQVQSKADSVTIKRLGLVPAAKLKETAKIDTGKTKVKAPVKNNKEQTAMKPATVKTDDRIKLDSLFLGADTLETQILTYKDFKILKQQRWDASHQDTSIKVIRTVMLTKPPKVLTLIAPVIPEDTSFHHRDIFGKPKPKAKPVPKKPLKPVDPKKAHQDSIKTRQVADSLQKIADHGLTDTSRIRIVSGHHHAKIFKSDLQAKADSMFYSYSDSTIRMFVRPMIWTQGSQLSGDTITLQMKNKKLDNIDLYPAAFIVNIEKKDSLHFNQVGGKTMHGTFKNDKLSTVLVSGNAETIAFKHDSLTNKATDMERSVSGKIRVHFKNGEVTYGALISKSESRLNTIEKVKDEDKVLKGFIWKPKDRPASKEAILFANKLPAEKKSATSKGSPGKGTAPGKGATKKPNKPGVNPSVKPPAVKPVKDTTLLSKPDTSRKPDTTKKIPVLKPKPAALND